MDDSAPGGPNETPGASRSGEGAVVAGFIAARQAIPRQSRDVTVLLLRSGADEEVHHHLRVVSRPDGADNPR